MWKCQSKSVLSKYFSALGYSYTFRKLHSNNSVIIVNFDLKTKKYGKYSNILGPTIVDFSINLSLLCSPDPTTNSKTTNLNLQEIFNQSDCFYKSKQKRLLISNLTSSNIMTSGLGNVRLRLLLVDEAKLEVVVW